MFDTPSFIVTQTEIVLCASISLFGRLAVVFHLFFRRLVHAKTVPVTLPK